MHRSQACARVQAHVEQDHCRLCPVPSAAMRHVDQIMRATAARECTILITGESGTGKEVTARAIHAASSRARGPFVPVDCAALCASLLESQLFGHRRGSFTGAETNTLGFFRAADGGTLFLDEIGELQPPMQAKLLRAIQDKAVVPLGAVDPIDVDARIIAATHRDLEAMVQRGTFRQDLYFRLNVVQIELPQLRQRPETILPLALHFLNEQTALYHESGKTLSDGAVAALLDYAWPGNIRELANAIEHGFLLAGQRAVIDTEHLPATVCKATRDRLGTDTLPLMHLDEAQRLLIAQALRATGGRRAQTARVLGIHRQRLYRLMHRFHLDDSRYPSRSAPH